MVENSVNSVPNDKLNTKKTSKLTVDQTLEILGQSFYMCEKEGIVLEVKNNELDKSVTITVHNVKFVDGVLKSIAVE